MGQAWAEQLFFVSFGISWRDLNAGAGVLCRLTHILVAGSACWLGHYLGDEDETAEHGPSMCCLTSFQHGRWVPKLTLRKRERETKREGEEDILPFII